MVDGDRDVCRRRARLPAVALDEAMLPAVAGPREAVGTVRPEAAAELGLAGDVLVGPGTGDNMGAALGLGLRPGEPVISLGTSGTAYLVSQRRPADGTGVVAGFADATGSFLPLACVLTARSRWTGWPAGSGSTGRPSRRPARSSSCPGSTGSGRRTCPGRVARSSGSAQGSGPGAILMATYEGIMASLLDALDRIDELCGGGSADTPIVLIGGGAEGSVWQETTRRLSGRPIRLPGESELVALGAAVQAASLGGDEDGPAIARRWAARGSRRDRILEPVAPDRAVLDRIRAVRERAIAAGARTKSPADRAGAAAGTSDDGCPNVVLRLDTATGLVEAVARTFEREEHKTRGDFGRS